MPPCACVTRDRDRQGSTSSSRRARSVLFLVTPNLNLSGQVLGLQHNIAVCRVLKRTERPVFRILLFYDEKLKNCSLFQFFKAGCFNGIHGVPNQRDGRECFLSLPWLSLVVRKFSFFCILPHFPGLTLPHDPKATRQKGWEVPQRVT